MFKKSRCTWIAETVATIVRSQWMIQYSHLITVSLKKQHSAFNRHREDMTLFCLTDSKMEGRWFSSLQRTPREERQKRKAAAAAEVAWSYQCRWDQILSNWRNRLLTLQSPKVVSGLIINVITILFSWNIAARQKTSKNSTHLQLAGRNANPFAAGCSGSNEVHSSMVTALKHWNRHQKTDIIPDVPSASGSEWMMKWW